jgi:hypothetical protein
MSNSIAKFILTTLICSTAFAQPPQKVDGYVPDEKTAVRVAEAVLSPIYGDDQITHERPFHASLHDGVWTVTGTLEQPSNPRLVREGGVAQIRIDMRTCAILSFTHGK